MPIVIMVTDHTHIAAECIIILGQWGSLLLTMHSTHTRHVLKGPGTCLLPYLYTWSVSETD